MTGADGAIRVSRVSGIRYRRDAGKEAAHPEPRGVGQCRPAGMMQYAVGGLEKKHHRVPGIRAGLMTERDVRERAVATLPVR